MSLFLIIGIIIVAVSVATIPYWIKVAKTKKSIAKTLPVPEFKPRPEMYTILDTSGSMGPSDAEIVRRRFGNNSSPLKNEESFEHIALHKTSRKRQVRGSTSPSRTSNYDNIHDDGFTTSMALGALTGDPILAGVMGGNFAGAMLGDALHVEEDIPTKNWEPSESPTYEAPMESHYEAPSNNDYSQSDSTDYSSGSDSSSSSSSD